MSWHKRRWSVALAAVAIVLVLTCWITLSDRRPASRLGSSALPGSVANEQLVPVLPVARPANGTSQVPTAPVPLKEARVAGATFQQVRFGENEVDYIGEDVTVRYFTPKPPVMPPKRPVGSAAQPVAPSGPVPAKPVSPKPAK